MRENEFQAPRIAPTPSPRHAGFPAAAPRAEPAWSAENTAAWEQWAERIIDRRLKIALEGVGIALGQVRRGLREEVMTLIAELRRDPRPDDGDHLRKLGRDISRLEKLVLRLAATPDTTAAQRPN